MGTYGGWKYPNSKAADKEKWNFQSAKQQNFHFSICKENQLTWYFDMYMFNLLLYILRNNAMQNSPYLIKIMFIYQNKFQCEEEEWNYFLQSYK